MTSGDPPGRLTAIMLNSAQIDEISVPNQNLITTVVIGVDGGYDLGYSYLDFDEARKNDKRWTNEENQGERLGIGADQWVTSYFREIRGTPTVSNSASAQGYGDRNAQ